MRWNSPHLLLTSRKGSKSKKNSERSIRMVSWIGQMQFWQQCRKNFAKGQNSFCSKSGNNIKSFYPSGNFFPLKTTFVYIRKTQWGQPCRKLSVKSPKFFWLNSKSDKKLKKISSTNFCSTCSSVQEESSFEKTVLKFLRWISPHLLLTSQKGSKAKKNSKKYQNGPLDKQDAVLTTMQKKLH